MSGDPELVRHLQPVIRAQAEELRQLRAARDRLELEHIQLASVLNHLPVGILIGEAPGGRLLTYNRALEEIFGFPPPLPDSIAEYGTAYPCYFPDGRRYQGHQWPLARALADGDTVVDEEILFVRPDGSRMICRVSAAPVRGDGGTITAGIMVLGDITGRRLEEERRELLGDVSDVLNASLVPRDSVQRLAQLCAEALGDLCVVHLADAGTAHAVGVAHRDPEREGLLRQVVRAVPLDGDHPILVAIRDGEPLLIPRLEPRRLPGAGEADETAELARRLDLTSAVVAPIRAGGRVLGTITLGRCGRARPFGAEELALAEEVAARAAHAVDNARLFREAQASAQARDEILGIVAHDLRNSLNAAMMNAELLLEVTPVFQEGSREHRQMDSVRRSLDHMHRLVQDLLEVDRIERGSLSLFPERIVPADFGAELQELFAPVARRGEVELRVEMPEGIPAMRADRARLMQAFGNLLGNAIRFSDPAGVVTVRAQAEGEWVRWEVADGGCGIRAADVPHVFDRFFQGRGRPGGRGSGLGLAITRGIVEALGGRIGVRSREGAGSTFWLTLPVDHEAGGA